MKKIIACLIFSFFGLTNSYPQEKIFLSSEREWVTVLEYWDWYENNVEQYAGKYEYIHAVNDENGNYNGEGDAYNYITEIKFNSGEMLALGYGSIEGEFQGIDTIRSSRIDNNKFNDQTFIFLKYKKHNTEIKTAKGLLGLNENNKIESFSELEISKVSDNFPMQFEKFKTTFNSKNISELNEYINPEYGFFVLDNPGATVNANHFNSFDSIFNNSIESNLYRIKKIELNCEPIRGNIPIYSCGDDGSSEGWDKEGCYYSDDFERIVTTGIYYFFDEHGNSGIDDNGNYTEANYLLQAKFNRNAGQCENVFYSTNFMIGLYFGEINGKFYLLMINLVTPCDA